MAAERPAEKSGADARATSAGRGGIAVLAAKVFFIVTGFVQQPLLKVVVGLADFGALAQALVVANTVNNVVVASSTQGVSRLVASAPGRESEALRIALRVHAPLGLAIALLVAAAAPAYAWFERADDVIAPLVVLAAVAFLYAVYAPMVGYLNGTKRFGRQAALDVTFAALRTTGLIGVGWLFVKRGLSGTLGTTCGWVLAAACIVPLALRSTGTGAKAAPGSPPLTTVRAYLAMLLPIAFAQFCTNLLMQTDIALLGRFLTDSAAQVDVSAALRRDTVKQWIAIYKECQTFAFLPYQLLFSVTLVLFPMLARARAEGDEEAVRTYVARGARLGAVFCALLVSVVAGAPDALLTFAYNASDAARGAPVLRVMAVAQGLFALLGLATTILTSLGRERTAALVNLGAVACVGGACWAVVPGAAFGQDQLFLSAVATASGLLLALGAAGVLVVKCAGAFVPRATLLRIAACVALAVLGGMRLPHTGRLAAIPLAALVAGGVVVLLVVTGELTKDDLANVRTLVSRRART